MITSDIAIEAIKEKIESLKNVQQDGQFYTWRKSTIGTLKRVVPNNETIFKNLESIVISTPFGGDFTVRGKQDAKILLESLMLDIQKFGLEESKKRDADTDKIHVNVNQHNSQAQTTNVNISLEILLDSFKGELRNSEIEELKEILESEDAPKAKKKNFFNKIKSFGSDVASNILANILTNPQVYEQIGKML